MKIDFANLGYQYRLYKTDIDQAIQQVLDSSQFIMGKEVSELESALQKYTDVPHAITCSSGTDALLLALLALDIKPEDEVITTPFSFISTSEMIAFLGATPVFVDIDESFNINSTCIETKITPKTKAILPVSLYGQPADMDAIMTIANKHGLKVIVDGAQSFGSTYKGVKDSALGDIAITSFFPAKPLGCYGDGGALFTHDEAIAQKVRLLRIHGQEKRYKHTSIGLGARLDTLQAAVLNVKLRYYPMELSKRQKVAESYSHKLRKKVMIPFIKERKTSTWAQYTIRTKNRDLLQKKLHDNSIPTAIHYPIPLHLQPCFHYLGYKKGELPMAEKAAEEVLSLPINPYLKEEEIDYVCENIL